MRLALSEADTAFRDELREFFTTQIPAEIRERSRSEGASFREDLITTQRILNKAGLAVPNWPVEWGGKDWTPLQDRVNPFQGFNRPDIDRKDPWQFKNFLITEDAG